MKHQKLALTTAIVIALHCFGEIASGQKVPWQAAIESSELLHASGKLDQASRLLLDLIQVETQLPPNGLAYLYNNLASVRQDQAKVMDARRYYLQSISEWEKAGDRYSMSLARTLNNYASLLWEGGRSAEAERYLLRSAGLQIAEVGPNQLQAVPLYYNLAAIHMNRKEWELAEASYEKVLSICDQFHEMRLEGAVAASTLAILPKKAGQRSVAAQLIEKAQRIWERSRHTADLQSGMILDLARTFSVANQQPAAESAVRQALDLLRSGPAKNNLRTARALSLHASILRKLKRKEEAKLVEKELKSIALANAQQLTFVETVHLDELMARQAPNGRRQ